MNIYEYRVEDFFYGLRSDAFLKIGAEVKIISVNKEKSGEIWRRKRWFVGKNAIIKEIEIKVDCEQGISSKFYRLKIEGVNDNAFDFTWTEDEISMNCMVVDESGNKLIINHPAIICITKDLEGNEYKGVSKCLPEDKFNFTKGVHIALLKSQKKYLDKRLKKLTKGI